MANSLDYFVHTQTGRQEFVKLLILSNEFIPIDEIVGSVSTGTYNVTNSSPIRRSCNLTIILNRDRLLPAPNSLFWLNRKFKLFTGIKNMLTEEIVWYSQGVYVIKSPAVNLKIDGNTLAIAGLDLAAMLNGDISGNLITDIKILAGTTLHEAIYSVITQLASETRIAIEATEFDVPYDIEISAGSTIWDIINTLLELYKNLEAYYDEDGYFIFKKASTLINDPVEWNFEEYGLVNSLTKSINYNNVKNEICIRGKILGENDGANIGLQPLFIIRVRNETAGDRQDKSLCHALMQIVNYPDSIFSQDKLGEPALRSFFVQEDNYYTLEQCRLRAEYEYAQHNNFAVKLSLTVVSIYCLKVNHLIQINDIENDVKGVFVVDDISGNLTYDGLMTINCSQVYEQ